MPRAVIFAGLADAVDLRVDDCVAGRAAALRTLVDEGWPIVFCSGRTRAELGLLQQRLGIRDPFVCESGAALFVPTGYFPFALRDARPAAGSDVIEFGEPHAVVLEQLRETAARLRVPIVGFADLSVDDVAAECNLSLLQARLAKFREYEEVFRVGDADSGAQTRLIKALRAAGLAVAPVGARYHRVGAVTDVGAGVRLLGDLYRRRYPAIRTIGFGLASQHLAMLAHVDHPFVTASPVGLHAAGFGPVAGARAIDAADMVRVVHEIAGAGGDVAAAPAS